MPIQTKKSFITTRQRASCVVATLAFALVGSYTRADGPRRVPNIEIHTADGQSFRLADFKGRVVLIDFWASWCQPCATSFPALDALYRDWHSRGLDVLAINLDEHRSDAETFLRAHPHVMPIVFDSTTAVFQAFALPGIPSTVIVDRAGKRRFTHTGYLENIVTQYRHEIETLLAEH